MDLVCAKKVCKKFGLSLSINFGDSIVGKAVISLCWPSEVHVDLLRFIIALMG